jgi:hypothetical protein
MADSPQRTAQVTLISILQALPIAVLVTTHNGDILTSKAEWYERAYAAETVLIVAIATYLLLVEVLAYEWPFPLYQPLLWFAFSAAECVLAAIPGPTLPSRESGDPSFPLETPGVSSAERHDG